MAATLLVAAHGTRSVAGLATIRALIASIGDARPEIPVSLCFLDVAAPSLADAVDSLGATTVVIVPLLLSAGYHVLTDIPSVVAGRSSVRVAAHLGPDPLIISAIADRLASVSSADSGSVALAAIESSQPSARAEVAGAAAQLSQVLGQGVSVLPLGGEVAGAIDELVAPVAVAVYLLADGGFLTSLRSVMAGRGVVAEPIGVHPSVVSLVWSRYDEAAAL